MTKPWKNTQLWSALTAASLALLIQGAAFAGGSTYSREKLKDSTTSQGDFSTPRPNIAEAQNLTAQAFDRLIDGQKAGEWDRTGHAQKAKAALQQARDELKLAAEATDGKTNGRKSAP
jgi:hypothetical protein